MDNTCNELIKIVKLLDTINLNLDYLPTTLQQNNRDLMENISLNIKLLETIKISEDDRLIVIKLTQPESRWRFGKSPLKPTEWITISMNRMPREHSKFIDGEVLYSTLVSNFKYTDLFLIEKISTQLIKSKIKCNVFENKFQIKKNDDEKFMEILFDCLDSIDDW